MAKIVWMIFLHDKHYKEQLKSYAKQEENILITWNVKAVNEDDQAVDATYGLEHEQL